MENHDLLLRIENLTTLIQIEKMKYSRAVTGKADFGTLLAIRTLLAKLRNELKTLQERPTNLPSLPSDPIEPQQPF